MGCVGKMSFIKYLKYDLDLYDFIGYIKDVITEAWFIKIISYLYMTLIIYELSLVKLYYSSFAYLLLIIIDYLLMLNFLINFVLILWTFILVIKSMIIEHKTIVIIKLKLIKYFTINFIYYLFLTIAI